MPTPDPPGPPKEELVMHNMYRLKKDQYTRIEKDRATITRLMQVSIFLDTEREL